MKLYLYNNKFSAIIFDMDGTLYPRAIYMTAYFDFTFNALQNLFGLSPADARQKLQTHGINRNPVKAQGSVSRLITSMGLSIKEWNEYRDQRFDLSSLVNQNRNLSGTISEISKFVKLALVTNNTQLMTSNILRKLSIKESIFSVIVTSDNGFPLKPDTDSFSHIKRLLNVSINEIISIGDRYEVDVEPVLQLGGNGVVISTPEEITDFCEKYISRNPQRSP
jgi:HAD superfamily hydrolase (TIGR01549 family)